MKTAITTLTAIVLLAPCLRAGTVTLDFGSLPSAQGWGYHGNVPESTFFDISGGVLTQNSIGIDHDPAYYSLADIVDPGQPFIISFRARVLEEEFGPDALAFAAQVDAGSLLLGVGPARSGVTVFGPGSSPIAVATSINTSKFHDYALIANPRARQWQLWVDGHHVARGAIPRAATGNAIYLGDLTDGGNARGEWTAFSFIQQRNRPSAFSGFKLR